jgi:uncharacterized membrane protein
MRGLVMVLMALDHASQAFNTGRLLTDGAFFYTPGRPLPLDQFLTRWITHICAPTFVFLAGTALALSTEKRLQVGASPASIDRHIILRGLIIFAFELLLISSLWTPGMVLFQVLYAIGFSLICMVALRRLNQRWLLAFSLALILGGELLAGAMVTLAGGRPNLVAGLLATGGQFGRLLVAYPLLPWLAVMALGWTFGRHLLAARRTEAGMRRTERLLAVLGALGVAIFLVVRGLNGYGNMLLPREDGSLVQWLHVSKYPPSLSFDALELGLMALCLSAFFRLQRSKASDQVWSKPLLVLGQTAFFFYLLHIPLLEGAARALGVQRELGLGATYVAAAGAVLILLPLCSRYRRYKAAHPDGWARYI